MRGEQAAVGPLQLGSCAALVLEMSPSDDLCETGMNVADVRTDDGSEVGKG